MNDRFTEHIFYSFTPKLATKATQCIHKAWSCFLSVPRLNPESSYLGFLSEIPQPNHRVRPKTQSGCSLRAFAFVSLRLLTTEKLFGIFERVFYRPAVGKATDHFARTHSNIGCKEKVVFFSALRLAADHQQYRLVRNAMPWILPQKMS